MRHRTLDEMVSYFNQQVSEMDIDQSYKIQLLGMISAIVYGVQKPQWIPCSERLPDKETYVLISKKPHPLTGKKWCVTIAGRFVDGRSRKLEWRDIGFVRIVDDEILAWMPLPELWRGEEHES